MSDRAYLAKKNKEFGRVLKSNLKQLKLKHDLVYKRAADFKRLEDSYHENMNPNTSMEFNSVKRDFETHKIILRDYVVFLLKNTLSGKLNAKKGIRNEPITMKEIYWFSDQSNSYALNLPNTFVGKIKFYIWLGKKWFYVNRFVQKMNRIFSVVKHKIIDGLEPDPVSNENRENAFELESMISGYADMLVEHASNFEVLDKKIINSMVKRSQKNTDFTVNLMESLYEQNRKKKAS